MRYRSSVDLTLLCLAVFFLTLLPTQARAQDLKGAVEQLARDLGNSVPEGRLLTVAISDFPDLQGGVSDLGRYISERLVTRLSARPEKFRVIERSRLSQVLAELRFNLTDLVDPAKAEQLGKMLGAQAIVVGTLSDLGNNVDVDARIIEIGTSSTLPGVSATLSKDETVRQLLERGRQLPSYGGSISSGMPMAPTAGAAAGFYESPELRVDVDSVKIVESRYIVFNVRYTNRRTTPLAVSLEIPTSYHISNTKTRASDDLGYIHDLSRATVFDSGPCILPPGVPVAAALTFYAENSPGKVFFLTSDVGLFDVDEQGQISDRRKTIKVLVQNLKAGK